MKRAVTALAASLGLASLVASGAAAQDADRWTGFYGGVVTTIISPELDDSSATLPLQEGTNFGAFAGYNQALGANFVGGVELHYGFPVNFQTTNGSPDFGFDRVLNARLRGGYALGNALIYGTFGYQQVAYPSAGIVSEGTATGPVYGIGMEMLLRDNVSFRIDYTSTHMNPTAGSIAGGSNGEQFDANAVGLGVALHF